MCTNHNPLQLCFILVNFIVVVVSLLIVVSSLSHQYDFTEVLPHVVDDDLQKVADSKPTPISPASWIHTFWAVIFVWHLIWSIYAVISVCRDSPDSDMPVYTSPPLLPVILLLTFNVACAFNITWFIVYDREYTEVATGLILLATLFAWCAYGGSLFAMDLDRYPFDKAEGGAEIRLMRFFIQNGLALYAMWCVFVLSFNLALTFIHNDDIRFSNDVATVAAMSVIAFAQIVFFIMDNVFLDHLARFTITPYVISIIVLIACLYRQDDWQYDDVNFIFLCAMLTFAFLAIMAKSACVAFREMKYSSGSGEISRLRSDPYQLTPIEECHYILK